jgi:hypothetical protein
VLQGHPDAAEGVPGSKPVEGSGTLAVLGRNVGHLWPGADTCVQGTLFRDSGWGFPFDRVISRFCVGSLCWLVVFGANSQAVPDIQFVQLVSC